MLGIEMRKYEGKIEVGTGCEKKYGLYIFDSPRIL